MTPGAEGDAGLGSVAAGSAASSEGLVPWDGVAQRVTEYLAAMGVTGALELELLTAAVRRRFQARLASAEVEDLLEVAIEEVNGLLDDWLDAELGMAGERGLLPGARAAVLSGAVPDWAARFSGVAGEGIAGAIHAAIIQPVPEPAPLAMEASEVLLCCHSLGRRIALRIRRLLGGQGVRGATPGAP